MSEVQVIEKGGKPEFYEQPASLWAMAKRSKMPKTSKTRRPANGDCRGRYGVHYPAAVAYAMTDGATRCAPGASAVA